VHSRKAWLNYLYSIFRNERGRQLRRGPIGATSNLGGIHRPPLAQEPIRIKLRLIAQLEIPMSNGPFKTWTAAHGRSVILNARQILKVDIFQENRIKVTFSNGGSEDFNATLADFQSWLLAVD
jgi:hypothetical protein